MVFFGGGESHCVTQSDSVSSVLRLQVYAMRSGVFVGFFCFVLFCFLRFIAILEVSGQNTV